MPAKKDVTGQRFGILTVIRDTDKRSKNGGIIWVCKCDCGITKNIASTSLMTGESNSCGCLAKQSASNIAKNVLIPYANEFDIKDNTRLHNLSQKVSKNNTSGIKGVCWDKNKQLWRAQIKYQSKCIYLGSFAKKEDAAKARKEAEEKYFQPVLEKYGRSLDKPAKEVK